MNSIYPFIKTFHCLWAYVVVLSSLLLFAMVLYHFITKKPVTGGLKKTSFYTVISFHIQFLVGIVLYITSPMIKGFWNNLDMKDSTARLFTVEHPFMMFTAVILITIANAKLKRSPLIKVSTLIFLILAMLCFYMIPWTAWLQ